jgi:hypothetical protein
MAEFRVIVSRKTSKCSIEPLFGAVGRRLEANRQNWSAQLMLQKRCYCPWGEFLGGRR